jgi:hypothetical protein
MLNYLVLVHINVKMPHYQIREGEEASYKTTEDMFNKTRIPLHIDDGNVRSFISLTK